MATLDTVATRADGTSFPTGKAYFETSTNKFIVWNGESWIELHSDGTGSFYSNQYSLSFNGNDQYLAFDAVSSSISNLTAVSYSCWYKGTDTSGYIFRASPSDSPNPHIGMSINSGTLYTTISNGSTTVYGNHGVTISDNEWHHLAVTFDGSTGVAKSYIDGNTGSNLQNTSGVPSTVGAGYGAANIGRRPTSTHLYTAGLIDEFALFDSALSATEVASLRDTSGTNPVPANIGSLNPMVWYRMGDNLNDTFVDGGSVASITDSSGNGVTATQGAVSARPTFSSVVPS